MYVCVWRDEMKRIRRGGEECMCVWRDEMKRIAVGKRKFVANLGDWPRTFYF
jgi:hypothetical protein